MDRAYFAAGCFWCVEAVFQRVTGVLGVKSGYCNGSAKNPTYQQVCAGVTGHAEVVEVVFDSDVVSFLELLAVFFKTHDPTTKNRQGADVGTQYRSAIFYIDEKQKRQALDYIASSNNADKITTEVTKLDIFYPAEDYHQNYYNQNQQAPYCQMVIVPKLAKYFQ